MVNFVHNSEAEGQRRTHLGTNAGPLPRTCYTYFEWQFSQLLSPLLCSLHHSKEHICVDSPFVGFIQNHTAILPKQGVWNCFSQKHAICQELDPGVFWGNIIKAHCIANLCGEIIHSSNMCWTPTMQPALCQALALLWWIRLVSTLPCSPGSKQSSGWHGQWTCSFNCNYNKHDQEFKTSLLLASY